MKKQKLFHIFDKVFGTNVLVIIGMPPEKVRPYLEKKYKINWEYGDYGLKAGAVMDFDTAPYRVLYLRKLEKIDFIPKLAHEVFHLVLRLCANRQIPTVPEIDGNITDETAAYVMEFYMREILEKLK